MANDTEGWSLVVGVAVTAPAVSPACPAALIPSATSGFYWLWLYPLQQCNPNILGVIPEEAPSFWRAPSQLPPSAAPGPGAAQDTLKPEGLQ